MVFHNLALQTRSVARYSYRLFIFISSIRRFSSTKNIWTHMNINSKHTVFEQWSENFRELKMMFLGHPTQLW